MKRQLIYIYIYVCVCLNLLRAIILCQSQKLLTAAGSAGNMLRQEDCSCDCPPSYFQHLDAVEGAKDDGLGLEGPNDDILREHKQVSKGMTNQLVDLKVVYVQTKTYRNLRIKRYNTTIMKHKNTIFDMYIYIYIYLYTDIMFKSI